MKKQTLSLAAALLAGSWALAQNTTRLTDSWQYRTQLAENLYQDKVLLPAKSLFDDQYLYRPSQAELERNYARFYGDIIAVLLEKPGAQMALENYLKENPESALLRTADMPLADYYIRQKDFQQARNYLGHINPAQLSSAENAQYILKVGYVDFMLGEGQKAIEPLTEVYNQGDEKYRDNVAYMLGHLNYQAGNSAEAFRYFDTLRDNPKFTSLVEPYYLQLDFAEKKYTEAITIGQKILSEGSSGVSQAEVNKIIGESYFMRAQYAEAYPYLKKYLETSASPSPADLYEMGFVAAKNRNFAEAVSYYNRITNEESALAQNAFYQLGNAYLQNSQKSEALAAYKSASEMRFDPETARLAGIQYGKLSYDIGNPFENASTVLQRLANANRNTAQESEIRNLLVKSLYYNGDYKSSLAAIDEIQNPSADVRATDQQISYLLGRQELAAGNYSGAEQYFVRSLKNSVSAEVTPIARYGLAQAQYGSGNFTEAIANFSSLRGKTFDAQNRLEYDLGYAYLKNAQFSEAISSFERYVSQPSPEFREDTLLRISESLSSQGKDAEALAAIGQISNPSGAALWQIAMSLGNSGDYSGKITALKKLLAEDSARENSAEFYYELGSAYAASGDFNNARISFDKVLPLSSDPTLTAQTHLYKVQLLLDQDKNDEARTAINLLGEQYKNSAYGARLASAAKTVYSRLGDAEGYAQFLSRFAPEVDAGEVNEVRLNAARLSFADKKYRDAVPQYQAYLAQNPTGDNAISAQYELAESLYQLRQDAQATALFQEILPNDSENREAINVRLAQLFLRQNNAKEAVPYLEVAAKSATPAIRDFAQAELLKYYNNSANNTDAFRITNVMSTGDSGKNRSDLLRAVMARQDFLNNRESRAKSEFASLEKSADPAVAAEALYVKAYFQSQAKNYKNSNATIFQLSRNWSSQEYWGAKALLLLGKNYIALKDRYQATYTLDQILANYQDMPEIYNEARQLRSGLGK